jgi:hypothetical protein
MPDRSHQLRTILLGDPPSAWEAAGFSTTDGAVVLGSTVIRLTGSGGAFEGWALDGVDRDLDGLVAAGAVPMPPAPKVEHPNGIGRIDHVVIATGDSDRTVDAFAEVGLALRGTREATGPGTSMHQSFFWAGDVILELVGPGAGQPSTDVPATLFGLALVAADLERTAEALGPLLGRPKPAVQQGRRIAGLRGTQVGISLPLAVMSPHVRSEGVQEATAG